MMKVDESFEQDFRGWTFLNHCGRKAKMEVELD